MPHAFPSARAFPAGVAQCGKTMLNGNPKVEPNYNPPAGTPQLSSALSLPLFDLHREIFGVLTIYAFKPDAFSRDHLRVLQAIESKFTLSLENARRFSTAEQDAQIDFITQLPNIRQFFLGMEAELNRVRPLARNSRRRRLRSQRLQGE